MKKLLAILLSVIMVLSLVACGNKPQDETPSNDDQQQNTETETKTIKVGLICIGDENDQGYTYNFIRGKEAATEQLAAKGINVDWVVKYNIGENSTCEDANLELAEEGCELIFNNSYGFEPFMLKVAPDYPEIQFVGCTNQGSWNDGLENTHNAFANIYEGRYVAGVVAGMKLQEMIDNGDITAEQAVIGYVGAFTYAEVVSGYTSFYLGAKSVCPTVTMDVTKAITEIKAGKVEYRLDKTAIIHCPVGKVSFGAQKIQENLTALMEAINKAKPAAAKGVYVRSLYISSTMGPSVRVNPLKF